MRTFIYISALATIAAVLSPGCKWTEFDDLESQAWVESTEKPDSNSNDYGIAMIRGLNASADGGTLVVLGAGQALYTELLYKPAGGASLDGNTEIKVNNQFGIGNLQQQPVLIADPTSDEVALVTNSGGEGSIAILAGTHTLTSSQVFGPSNPDGATYISVASQMTATKPSSVLVAAMGSVYGFAAAPNPQPKCNLLDVDGTTPVMVRGIVAAQISAAPFDDIVVWGDSGKLYIYDGNAFDGCADPGMVPLSVPVDVGFVPVSNANMHIVNDHYLVLAGHHDNDDKARIAVYDLTNMNATPAFEPKLIGAPLDRDGLKASTVLSAQGKLYVVGGYPLAPVEGVVAGQVLVFDLDLEAATLAGIDPTPAASLNDAQPESNQAFGRALTTFPYNGSDILAVGADNEVFAYYQSPLYGETRRK